LLPHQEYHEPNTSAVSDVLLALRRQPWDQWARRTLDMVKSLLQLALPVALLPALLSTLLLPAPAHARTYEVFSADVPFKFNVGDRTFDPGRYDFIFAGPGLVTVRDSRERVVATFVVRSINASEPASASKLVFRHEKKHALLSQIWIASQPQFTEILGEELAMPSPTIEHPIPVIPMFNFFGYERNAFHFKE